MWPAATGSVLAREALEAPTAILRCNEGLVRSEFSQSLCNVFDEKESDAKIAFNQIHKNKKAPGNHRG